MFGVFFFQAEDGIRDLIVTGVQTCALPIYAGVPGTAAPAGLAAVERAPAARMPPAAGGRRGREALVGAQLSRRLHLLQLGAPHASAVAGVCLAGPPAGSARPGGRAPAAAGCHRPA